MIITISLVNIQHLTEKQKKKIFPCDENSRFTLFTAILIILIMLYITFLVLT